MTLEGVYNKYKAEYDARAKEHPTEYNYWDDEGKVYAIQDYLSSMGEMSEADWEFAKKVGIDDICHWVLEND